MAFVTHDLSGIDRAARELCRNRPHHQQWNDLPMEVRAQYRREAERIIAAYFGKGDDH